MSRTNTRVFRSLVVAGAVVASVAGAPAAAYAGSGSSAPKTFNNATVNINGGNAAALAGCVNVAKVHAKHNRVVQSNFCKNFATAVGGSVTLKNTDILIAQGGTGSGTTVNNATVNISGGDAVALAACVNYLQGTSSASQKNLCKNSAVAKGGDVVLKNSTITIIQG